MRNPIYKIVAKYKNGSKDEVSLDIWYEKGKRETVPCMKFSDLSFGWFVERMETNTATECRSCIIGSIKRFFHIA